MIRLVFTLFLAICSIFTAFGQSAVVPKLVWKVNRIDLGTLLEEQGKQSVVFDFMVSQGSSFFIQEVAPDCGCTTVAFAKDTLMLGQLGQIQVDFDPSSAAGFFSKLVVVRGGQGQVQDSLYIEGIALPYPANLDRNYPVKVGFLGLRMKILNMGEVFDNEPKVKYLEFFNYSIAPLEKKNFNSKSPSYILLEQVQELVRPKERGLLKISYQASLRPDLGAVSDKVTYSWNQDPAAALELDVLADLFDYFAPISKDQLEEVPQLYMEQKIVDLGKISANALVRKTVTLTNLGKKDLEIRKVQGNCACLTLELGKSILASGDKTDLTLVFDPTGRKGIDQRNIYLFTNDPVNPVQLLVLKSRVE
jgi:hypothetical protein